MERSDRSSKSFKRLFIFDEGRLLSFSNDRLSNFPLLNFIIFHYTNSQNDNLLLFIAELETSQNMVKNEIKNVEKQFLLISQTERCILLKFPKRRNLRPIPIKVFLEKGRRKRNRDWINLS